MKTESDQIRLAILLGLPGSFAPSLKSAGNSLSASDAPSRRNEPPQQISPATWILLQFYSPDLCLQSKRPPDYQFSDALWFLHYIHRALLRDRGVLGGHYPLAGCGVWVVYLVRVSRGYSACSWFNSCTLAPTICGALFRSYWAHVLFLGS